jgi:hypothetical protein
MTADAKPTVESLGIDVAAQDWHRSGSGEGAIEIAFVGGGEAGREDGPGADPGSGAGAGWVLMRVAGDPDGRVLVYDHFEWECFLEGARNGEFDDAAR